MLRNSSGITLIELIVVIGIIVILLSLATISFNNYQVGYNVENEIKTLYSDIMGARMHALNENTPYVVEFTSSTSYVTAIDNNKDGYYNQGDIKMDKYSKDNIKYGLIWALSANANRITLDNRGMVNVNGTVRVNKENSSEYDCIVISNTRIKMGKWNGTECAPK